MKKTDYDPQSEADQTLGALEHLQTVPDDPWLATRVEARLRAAHQPAPQRPGQLAWKWALASLLVAANLLTILKPQSPQAQRQTTLDQVVADIYQIRSDNNSMFNF